MQDDNTCHELSGYKFSFNRVNPYLISVIPQSQSKQVRPKNSNRKYSEIPLPTNKKQINSSFKIESLKQKTENASTKNVIKNTKPIFYTNFNENQKNKMLSDLYLRKTKFNKMKLTARKSDKNEIKKKLTQITQVNPDVPNIVHIKDFSSVKENLFQSQEDKNDSQIRKQFQLYSESEIKQSDEKGLGNELQKNNVESLEKKFKKPNRIKLIRNLSQKKFCNYQTSPKQNLKLRVLTIETAPIYKLQNEEDSVNSLIQGGELNVQSQKKKNRKKFPLQINTEQSYINYESDFIKIQSASNKETIRKNIGALNYKSPRMLISTRNSKFPCRKETYKMRLFTEQEEKDIIKEFYSQQKDAES